MKFGLVANLHRQGARDAIDTFVRWVEKSHNELILCDQLKSITENSLNYAPRAEMACGVDILVSMGGDGTMLASARAAGTSQTPILGINLGSLGFLTQLTPQQLLPALESITKGKYQIEKHMMLKAEAPGIETCESEYALNDIVIDNGPISRIIDIHMKVNGEDVVTYKADGLVIATPTGSTAYSLAVGGPIMHPKMEAIIAAPISSFSLTTRPMIFSAEDRLDISITSFGHQAGLTLDGQVMLPLEGEGNVGIVKADYYSNFIVFPENSFYKVLKSKLHWGYTPTTTL